MSKKFSNILINTTHYVAASDSYVYRFNTKLDLSSAKVSAQSINLFNSTYNISSSLGNNAISIIWRGVTYNFTIPDGFYSYDDFNNYVRLQCIIHKLYMLTSTNDFVYFINVSPNASSYKCQFDFYTIPTSAQASVLGYTIPVGATWTFPTTQITPQLQIPSGLLKYFGHASQQLFPLTPQNANTVISSTTYPQVNPTTSYVFLCNLINSSVSIEPTVFTQVPLSGFGELMKITNNHDSAIDCSDGQYAHITIRLVSDDLSPLQRIDKDLSLILKLEY